MKIELPDFEDMQKLITKIRDLSYQKMKLELLIKEEEAKVFQIAVVDTKYFDKNGKPPSATFIENAYKTPGLDGGMFNLRLELVGLAADLDLAKMELQMMQNKIEVWRSEQANNRASLLSM